MALWSLLHGDTKRPSWGGGCSLALRRLGKWISLEGLGMYYWASYLTLGNPAYLILGDGLHHPLDRCGFPMTQSSNLPLPSQGTQSRLLPPESPLPYHQPLHLFFLQVTPSLWECCSQHQQGWDDSEGPQGQITNATLCFGSIGSRHPCCPHYQCVVHSIFICLQANNSQTTSLLCYVHQAPISFA